MLVLTRKLGESLVLFIPPLNAPQRVVIKVSDVRSGGHVQLSTEAPREIQVFRDELLSRQPTDSPSADSTVAQTA